jgi:parvulin-like peptidyl-prolyl isomerase
VDGGFCRYGRFFAGHFQRFACPEMPIKRVIREKHDCQDLLGSSTLNRMNPKNISVKRLGSGMPLAGWVSVLSLFLLLGCSQKSKTPPSPGIVATYDSGEITVDSLENYAKQRAKDVAVLVGDSLVSLRNQIIYDKEIYRGLIREMVIDDLVKRKIKEKQLDNRSNIRHALQHIEEEVTLQQLHEEMHEKDKIPVSEIDIQKYYDENRNRFGDKSLYEVRDEIRTILASQGENEYIINYIAELKDEAGVTKYYDILRVPEPTNAEVREAYQKNKESYREPEKWVIEQIEIADTTTKAGKTAQKAWNKLGSGETFTAVAEQYGKDGVFTTIEYIPGTRGKEFDGAVASLLNPGEYSRPIREGNRFFIVRLKEKIPASYIPFEEVKNVIRRYLKDEKEKTLYEENKNKTLFMLHGRRFTLGDFYQEFKELPASEQEKYRSYEQRIMLVDKMLERLLLLEDSYDRMLNAKKKEEIEHVREDVLKQAFHREEVDDKLEVSDEEVRNFYEENKERYKTSPRVKISMILVRRGEDETADEKVKAKIEEAYKKLKSGFFKKGTPFEQVAQEYSEDPASAKNGGKLDYWIGESNNPIFEAFNHAFHQQFIDLEVGETTEPFSVGHDYVIVKVREREAPRQRSFDEVKEHLIEDLKLQKHNELSVKMYNDIIAQADLVIYDQVLDSLISVQEEVSSSQ